MAEKRILMSVGDDSADLHAAHLMRAMREREPQLRFVGFGMGRMQAAGLEPLEESRDSAMWLHNVLRIGDFRQRLRRCEELFERGEVDLFVPVDFGGFNLYACRAASRHGVPVFYYIPPQVWAHGRYRLKKLRKWTTRVGLIYPFEPPLYERYGVDARYVGHPLFDELAENPPSEEVVAGLRERFGRQLVGVFPGSRLQEVRAHARMLAECCRRVLRECPDAAFALICPAGIRPEAERLLGEAEAPIELLQDVRPVELARAARLCLTKSGTITLEIASQGTPMVIFYRTNPLLYFIASGLSDSPYAGLANVLAGREVCPEKVMARDEPGWLAHHALRFLQSEEDHAACRRAIEGALNGFARPGASERAADAALELL
ncbi:MAG: lipid-A-disaccharide synthase [Candidatus Brocadiia bacterium]